MKLKLAYFLRMVLPLAALGTAGASAQVSVPVSQIPAPVSKSQPRNLTLQQYVSELDRSQAILLAGDPAAARRWLSNLPGEWVVETNERSYHIKTDWLKAALSVEGKTPDEKKKNAIVEEAKLRLAALRDAAQSLLASAAGDDLNRSHATLDRILQAREFQGAHGPSYFDTLRARLFGWIERQLVKIFGRMRGASTIGNILAWGLISIAALLLAIWAVRVSFGRSIQIDLSDSSPVGRDWRDWFRDARTAAAQGDFRAAIHAAYWAAVVRLEEKQILPEDRSRTPRESLRMVDRRSPAHLPLARLTSRLELVWYGYCPATASDWTDVSEQLERIECLDSSIPKTPGS